MKVKKIVIAAILGLFIASTVNCFALDTPKDKASSGMNDIVYGQVEVPDNINATNSKGAKAYESCTDKTKTGVERGIARFVGGLWKVATFWYADTEEAKRIKGKQ